MKILPNGYFSIEYTTEELAKGLRPSARLPRNNKFLTDCKGAVGHEGILRTIDLLTLTEDMMSSVVLDDFPFPQLFILDDLVVLCNKASIYEWKAGALVLALDALPGGGKWSMVSSHQFVYASNGTVVVVRNPESGVWALDTTGAPKSSAICNFNGQLIVGTPR